MKSIDWKKGDGLVPAIVQDADSGRVLMLAYMNAESLQKTHDCGQVTFFSRSRQTLWSKGETSGNSLAFVSINVDCDGDTLLIRARPAGPVCHKGTTTCFQQADTALEFLRTLTQIIENRFADSQNTQAYVANLVRSGIDRMAQKVGEEAVETVIAAKNQDTAVLASESADLLFHLMVLLRARGLSLHTLVEVLRQRHAGKS